MQLIQCSLLLSALYVFWAIFFAHHQELKKLYMQPWVLSGFPVVYHWCGWVRTEQYPRLHIQFYKFVMMGEKIAQNMYSADNNK
jgi:hypothetical protein